MELSKSKDPYSRLLQKWAWRDYKLLRVDKRKIMLVNLETDYITGGTKEFSVASMVHALAIRNKVMALLIMRDAGFDIGSSSCDSKGFSPLHYASFGDYHNFARVLLQAGHRPDTFTNGVPHHWTPLHIASILGCPSTVKVLLGHCADPNARSQTGATPIFMASVSEHRLVRWGICGGWFRAFAEQRSFAKGIERLSGIEASEWRFSRDSPIFSKEPISTISVIEVIEILLARGAKLNVWDQNGSTPLLLASRYASVKTVTLLLERGSDINAKDRAGNTVVDEAAKRDSSESRDEMVQFLIERGAPKVILNGKFSLKWNRLTFRGTR
jgi:ankyrin repeat protein